MRLWGRLSDAARGRVLILTAAVLWSTSGAFVKSMPQIPDIAIAMYRALAAGAALFVLARLLGARISWQPAMAGMALCFASMNYLFIAAMTRTTAANTIFLQYTAPIWMVLGSILWLKEPLVRRNLFTAAGGMVGIAVLLFSQWDAATGQRWGLVCGLGSGATYAGVAVYLRFLRRHDALWLATINHLAAGGLLAFGLAIGGLAGGFAPSKLSVPTIGELSALTVFGVGQMATPYVLFAMGLRRISPQEAATLTLIEPMLTPLWTFLKVGERPSAWTLGGGAILLAMLALRFVPSPAAAPARAPT